MGSNLSNPTCLGYVQGFLIDDRMTFESFDIMNVLRLTPTQAPFVHLCNITDEDEVAFGNCYAGVKQMKCTI